MYVSEDKKRVHFKCDVCGKPYSTLKKRYGDVSEDFIKKCRDCRVKRREVKTEATV